MPAKAFMPLIFNGSLANLGLISIKRQQKDNHECLKTKQLANGLIACDKVPQHIMFSNMPQPGQNIRVWYCCWQQTELAARIVWRHKLQEGLSFLYQHDVKRMIICKFLWIIRNLGTTEEDLVITSGSFRVQWVQNSTNLAVTFKWIWALRIHNKELLQKCCWLWALVEEDQMIL